MSQYQTKILENLNLIIECEQESIEQATKLLVDAILNHHSIYAFGASHAGMLSQELFYRAGGLININPIFVDVVLLNISPITLSTKMEQMEGFGDIVYSTVDFKENDVLILHSVSGRNPLAIEMALNAQKNKVKVIAVTNLAYSQSVTSRHSSGKRLFELADIVLNTHGEYGDAIVPLKNGKQKVGAASTINSSFIMNTIVVGVAQIIDEQTDKLVPVFYSANMDNTQQLNDELVELYQDSIHYKF